MVVQLGIHTEVRVGTFSVYFMTHGAMWPPAHINIQKGELFLHGELDVMYATEMVKEVIQFFWSMPDRPQMCHKLLETSRRGCGLVTECPSCKVLHGEIGNHMQQGQTHGLSIRL
jgi:hypothetical protein